MDPRSAARCEAGGQRRILPPRVFPRQLAPPPGRGAGPRGRRGRRPPRGVTATGHHPSSPAVPGRNLAVDRPSPQPGSTGSSRRSGLPGPWSAPDPARSTPDHAQGCARSPRPGSTGPSPARQLLSVRSTGQLAPQTRRPRAPWVGPGCPLRGRRPRPRRRPTKASPRVNWLRGFHSASKRIRIASTPMSPGSLNWLLGLHARRSRANTALALRATPLQLPGAAEWVNGRC